MAKLGPGSSDKVKQAELAKNASQPLKIKLKFPKAKPRINPDDPNQDAPTLPRLDTEEELGLGPQQQQQDDPNQVALTLPRLHTEDGLGLGQQQQQQDDPTQVALTLPRLHTEEGLGLGQQQQQMLQLDDPNQVASTLPRFDTEEGLGLGQHQQQMLKLDDPNQVAPALPRFDTEEGPGLGQQQQMLDRNQIAPTLPRLDTEEGQQQQQMIQLDDDDFFNEELPWDLGYVDQYLDRSFNHVDINGFLISKENAEVIKYIFIQHPEVAESIKVTIPEWKNRFLETSADVWKKIKNEELTSEEIRDILKEIKDLEFVGLKLSWLMMELENREEFKAEKIRKLKEIIKSKTAEVEQLERN